MEENMEDLTIDVKILFSFLFFVILVLGLVFYIIVCIVGCSKKAPRAPTHFKKGPTAQRFPIALSTLSNTPLEDRKVGLAKLKIPKTLDKIPPHPST